MVFVLVFFFAFPTCFIGIFFAIIKLNVFLFLLLLLAVMTIRKRKSALLKNLNSIWIHGFKLFQKNFACFFHYNSIKFNFCMARKKLAEQNKNRKTKKKFFTPSFFVHCVYVFVFCNDFHYNFHNFLQHSFLWFYNPCDVI